MARRSRIGICLTCAVLLSVAADPVRGGVFNDIALGLDYAGFNFLGRQNVNIRGRENLLSGGVDFLTSVNFNGSPLDFGPGDLALNGPVSVDISTGGRALRTLDISFKTALSGDGIATPLAYALNLDSGAQASTIQGSILLDADLTVNQFGFYDATFAYSSRQDVTRGGRFAADENSADLDIGPIRVRGNLFADVLAVLTAPLFEAAGQPNLFAGFSESARLKSILTADASGVLVANGAAGNYPFDFQPQASILLGEAGRPAADGATSFGAVPEPTVLMLLLLGVPAILSSRSQHRPGTRKYSRTR